MPSPNAHFDGPDGRCKGVAPVRWRERCPADMIVGRPPGHPRRRPDVSGYPEPAITVVIAPAAVMIGGPAERFVGNPIPPIVVRIDPATLLVGSPVCIDVGWQEYEPMTLALHPTAMGREFIEKHGDIDAYRLGEGWWRDDAIEGQRCDRSGQAGERQGRAAKHGLGRIPGHCSGSVLFPCPVRVRMETQANPAQFRRMMRRSPRRRPRRAPMAPGTFSLATGLSRCCVCGSSFLGST